MNLTQRIDALQFRLHSNPPEPTYTFRIVSEEQDGFSYAVFNNEFDLISFDRLYPDYFEGCSIICFDGYYNAFELGYMN